VVNGECKMRRIIFPAGHPAGVVDAPIPVPGPGQLLVGTEAVGVGVGLVRMLEAGDAVRPGGEMVGTVVSAGPEVAGFEVGDRVRPPVRCRRSGDLSAVVLG
jgi:NADPH:quinone reductase-like Zn-dependent oxidoreductase